MAKNIVRRIQDLIDQTDPRRKLGRLGINKTQNFNIAPPELTQPDITTQPEPDKDPFIKNIKPSDLSFTRKRYLHDRGAFAEMTPESFNVRSLITDKGRIAAPKGNFRDVNFGNNVNVSYFAMFYVGADTSVPVNINTVGNASVSVYTQKVDQNLSLGPMIKQYSSGPTARHSNGTIFLYFDGPGTFMMWIYYYHQRNPIGAYPYIELSGDLGAYVESQIPKFKPPDFRLTFSTAPATTSKSEFVDGAYGPTLQNTIFWDRMPSSSKSKGDYSLSAYVLNSVETEVVDYTVVSGWGTDAFTVSGDKRLDFPIALNIATGDALDSYQVSGTEYLTEDDETVVTVSGNNWTGSAADLIRIERLSELLRVSHDSTTSPIVSGAHIGIQSGKTYTYELAMIDDEGNIGGISDRISVTAGDFTAPSKVSDVLATGGNKRVLLSWNNPAENDFKGINIWDTDNPTSDDKPVKTVLKSSNDTVVSSTYVSRTQASELDDDTSYTFYISTFDWAGNETITSLPNGTASTTINIKTKQSGQRIETDSSTNQLRFYDSSDNLIVEIGENVSQSKDGLIAYKDGIIASESTSTENTAGTPIMYSLMNINSEEDTQFTPFVSACFFDGDNEGTNENRFHLNIASQTGKQGLGTLNAGEGLVGLYAGHFAANERWNDYTGYFVGAKVYIQKNVVVSGNLRVQNDDSTGRVSIGDDADPVNSRLHVFGTQASNSLGPHARFQTDEDAYPVMQILPWQHDSAYLSFDSYYDSGWKSSDAGSNYILAKVSDKFYLQVDSGIAAGSGIIGKSVIVADTNQNVAFGGEDTPLNRIHVSGTASSATSGPHMRFETSTDIYPSMQLLNWDHDNIAVNFDSYFDGSNWKSSDVGSNFQIYKLSDTLEIRYDSSIAAGSNITWNPGISLDTSGNVGIGITTTTHDLHVVDSATGAGPTLRVENTSGLADTFGPILYLATSRSSPGDGDTCGSIIFQGHDSGDADSTFVSIIGYASDVTAGDEGGRLLLSATMDGAGSCGIELEGYNGVVNKGTITVNNNDADVDFRVKADSGNTILATDAEDECVGIGTTGFPGTSPANTLIFAEKSGDPSNLAVNTAGIYAKVVSGASEMFAIDENGNATQLSPHNEKGEWQFYSKNTKTGRVMKVNMEKMIRKLEELTGENFIEEYFEPTD